jgi:hypothetical protein
MTKTYSFVQSMNLTKKDLPHFDEQEKCVAPRWRYVYYHQSSFASISYSVRILINVGIFIYAGPVESL